jgi:hypothetical protein
VFHVATPILLGFIIGFVLGRLVAKPGKPLGSVIVVSAFFGFVRALFFEFNDFRLETPILGDNVR